MRSQSSANMHVSSTDLLEAMPAARDVSSVNGPQRQGVEQNVTVLIPTCKRPALLRTALESVSQQSAKLSIREIVVIENGLDRGSEEVCRAFGSLPIKYVFREKPLPPGSLESVEATEEWLRTVATDFVAILFDDDWWAPNHLQRALEGFSIVPDAAASFCSFLITTGESRHLAQVRGSFVPWFASAGRQVSGRWVLGLPDLIVGGLMDVPVHYSSMVVKREAFLASLPAVKDGNPCDSDRAIAVELAAHGKILCDLTPTIFVRIHPMQEHQRLTASGETIFWHHYTTQQIVKRAEQNGIGIREEFARRMRATGASVDNVESNCIHDSFDFLLRENFIDATWTRRNPVVRAIKKAIKEVTPPIMWKLKSRGTDLLASVTGRQREV